MGNCYSADSDKSEVIIEGKALPKRYQAEGLEEESLDIDIADMKAAQETIEQLKAFISNLQSSNPALFNETIDEIRNARGEPYTWILSGPQNVAFHSLVYRSAIEIDGSVYEGQWNEYQNQIEGLGVKVSKDGSIYEGIFKSGKANGRGRFLNSQDNVSYDGEWLDNNRNGYGKTTSQDGTVYEGNWFNNQKSGQGIERWQDGGVYDGHFSEGKKFGEGFFKWSDGSTYQGTFNNDMLDGNGTYRWADNRSYVGQWKMNKMHGKGDFSWEDGRSYSGDYFDDKKHGQGRFVWPDNRVYEGSWADGRQHGLGNYTTPDGTIREGEWVDGKRTKWTQLVNKMGQFFESNFSTAQKTQGDVSVTNERA